MRYRFDDSLCLVALFAKLPANERIPSSLIEDCARLYKEWLLYIINKKSLRKVFLSIEGVYYQAIVQGETITWIVPWQFIQTVSPSGTLSMSLTCCRSHHTSTCSPFSNFTKPCSASSSSNRVSRSEEFLTKTHDQLSKIFPALPQIHLNLPPPLLPRSQLTWKKTKISSHKHLNRT